MQLDSAPHEDKEGYNMILLIILGINIVLIGIGIPAWISIPFSIACCLPAFESSGTDSTPIPRGAKRNDLSLEQSTDPARYGENDSYYAGSDEWCDLQ